MPLKLNDFLRLDTNQINNAKVRLNTHSAGVNPLDIFKQNPKKLLDWNYWNNKTYKKGQLSIGLINMGNDEWLLFTVGEITSVDYSFPKNTTVAVTYDTMTQYNDYYGRLILKYHNTTQQMFRNARSVIDDLIVKELLPNFYTGFEFLGYENVSLSYGELATIVNGNYPSYQNALKMQKAVYLQTDKATGKLYVGSATSKKGMLLARWSSYVKNGHGGNIELKDLVQTKGFQYIKDNFQYTIIENFNEHTDDNYVLQRESYWKKVLQSQKFGYNRK